MVQTDYKFFIVNDLEVKSSNIWKWVWHPKDWPEVNDFMRLVALEKISSS